MCLIIHLKDKEVGVTPEEFKLNLNKNTDGTGFMFANHNRVIVNKSLGTISEQVALYEKYSKSVAGGGLKDLFIHSRWATQGTKDEFNCHPYQILTPQEGNELWCMHNGVISGGGTKQEADKSDTYNFLTFYLKPLLIQRDYLLSNPLFMEMIEKFIGTGSKLVFLNSKGQHWYANKSQGVMYKDTSTWISNEYSGLTNKKVYTYPKKTQTNYGWSSEDYDDYDSYYLAKNPTTTNEVLGGKEWVNKAGKWYKETVVAKTVEGTTIDLNKPDYLKIAANLVKDKPNQVISLPVIIKESKKKEPQGSENKAGVGSKAFEEKAVAHGIKLLIAAATTMSEQEVYNIVMAEPIIATEILMHLLNETEIMVGV